MSVDSQVYPQPVHPIQFPPASGPSGALHGKASGGGWSDRVDDTKFQSIVFSVHRRRFPRFEHSPSRDSHTELHFTMAIGT
jgi:hypothetical protein